MKKAYFIIGLNGAGKSTLRDVEVEFKHPEIVVIDPDKIARELRCSELQAGRMALRLFKESIHQEKDFLVENTLTSKTAFAQMDEAKKAGYQINCYYVGLVDLNEHIERVQFRVLSGGHNIPIDTIKDRFEKSYSNIQNLFSIADNLSVYDNTEQFHLEFQIINKVRQNKAIKSDWVKTKVEQPFHAFLEKQKEGEKYV